MSQGDGTNSTSGTRGAPKGSPWFECPVCGRGEPQTKRIWQKGRYVCPRCYDNPGYREPRDMTGPPPPDDLSSDSFSDGQYIRDILFSESL